LYYPKNIFRIFQCLKFVLEHCFLNWVSVMNFTVMNHIVLYQDRLVGIHSHPLDPPLHGATAVQDLCTISFDVFVVSEAFKSVQEPIDYSDCHG